MKNISYGQTENDKILLTIFSKIYTSCKVFLQQLSLTTWIRRGTYHRDRSTDLRKGIIYYIVENGKRE